MSRMMQISELIKDLQQIHERWGDTCCYVYGLAWGSAALWKQAYEDDINVALTPDWMWHEGWRFHNKSKHHWHHKDIPSARWDDRENELMIGSDDMGWILIKRGATRDQVRLLKTLLGVEPKR